MQGRRGNGYRGERKDREWSLKKGWRIFYLQSFFVFFSLQLEMVSSSEGESERRQVDVWHTGVSASLGSDVRSLPLLFYMKNKTPAPS